MQKLLTILFLSALAINIKAQQPAPAWKEIGALKALSAKDIRSSRWSVGGETLDRNYADYHAYKSYLGPLGAKRLRLQAGWARCEKTKGRYDFTWLDSIVNDALSQAVQPWVEVAYGNPIYEGGGDAALAGGLPVSAEALAAWDAWVSALVRHFKGRVHEWEIWNEPDLGKKFTAKDYAVFYARTGTVIRKEQANARLIGLALCCSGWPAYAQTLVDYLKSAGRLDLLNVVTLHGYKLRPEETYAMVEEVKKVVLAAKPDVAFWQGENGAPSVKKGEAIGALTEFDWSELTQAKWNLRRMFGDMGADMEVTNVFSMSDMYYGTGDHMAGLNAKGLLKARPDKTIEKRKLAYYAYQHSASLFSEKITRNKKADLSGVTTDLSAFAYQKNGKPLLTLWMSSKPVAEDNAESRTISFTATNVSFKEPVYVDLISGKVYEIPSNQFKKGSSGFAFSNIPVPDYPVVIAERSLVDIKLTATGELHAQALDDKTTAAMVSMKGVYIQQVSSGRVIHRFFDTSPISPSGHYIALFRLPYENRSPQPGDAGDVVVIELKTGKEIFGIKSRGWEVQLGANVQWGASDKELLFNDVDTTNWKAFCKVVDPFTGGSRRLDGTIFMASNDGKRLASYNLAASRYAQVGYGVIIPEKLVPRNIGPVDNDGIYITDMVTGKCKRIATIRDIYEKTVPSIAISNPQDYEYYCFQVKWNPQATRLLTTVQWSPVKGGARLRSVITMRPDGSDIRTAVTPEQWEKGGHHVNWMPDGIHLSMNLNTDGIEGLELISVKYDGSELKTVFTPGSGHPSFHPKGLPLIITDAYPNEPVTKQNGTVPIRLLHTDTGKEDKIADVFVSRQEGEFRIDPHPAWDRTGRYVVFNGYIGDTRNVFVADLGEVINRNGKK